MHCFALLAARGSSMQLCDKQLGSSVLAAGCSSLHFGDKQLGPSVGDAIGTLQSKKMRTFVELLDQQLASGPQSMVVCSAS
eukprot:3230067-Rhodomonas_salina.2